MKGFGLLVLSLFALFYVSAMGAVQAVSVNNNQMVEYSSAQKQVWLRSVFDTYGDTAFQSSPVQARCIREWLNDDTQVREQFLLNYLAHHTREVTARAILVFLKNDCHFEISGA